MDHVRKMVFGGKEILVVDYSGWSGDKLITIFDEAINLVLAENKHCVVLSIFDDRTFVSPAFMRHIETRLEEASGLIDKQAIIGVSKIQGSILKGMNSWYSPQLQSFDTQEEALDYLTK